MNQLKEMLEAYRNGERGLPTYDELAAVAYEEPSKVVRDAQRYRWLRDRMAVEDVPGEHPAWSVVVEDESQKFDAGVDAAMLKKATK